MIRPTTTVVAPPCRGFNAVRLPPTLVIPTEVRSDSDGERRNLLFSALEVDRVERTLLSAAFDVARGFDFVGRNKSRNKLESRAAVASLESPRACRTEKIPIGVHQETTVRARSIYVSTQEAVKIGFRPIATIVLRKLK
jgi:hypothetical protein